MGLVDAVRFLVISTGRDCAGKVEACLSSIVGQEGDHSVEIVATSDCSTDDTAGRLREFFDAYPMSGDWWAPDRRRGAMANQWESWHWRSGWDVAVWVDLDDRLAHPHVLERVAQEYEAGAVMTYGSYEPVPPSATCPPVLPYPPEVAAAGTHRAFMRAGGGFRFNHLRTVSRDVLMELSEVDCRDSNGDWWMVAPDAAVMIPCMEIARDRCHVIDETLLLYSSDCANAEWRVTPGEINRAHRELLSREPKRPVSVPDVRVAQQLGARRTRQTRPTSETGRVTAQPRRPK